MHLSTRHRIFDLQNPLSCIFKQLTHKLWCLTNSRQSATDLLVYSLQRPRLWSPEHSRQFELAWKIMVECFWPWESQSTRTVFCGLCGEASSQAYAYVFIQSAKSAKLGCSILMLLTCWFQQIVIGVVNFFSATLATAEAFRCKSKWWIRKVCTKRLRKDAKLPKLLGSSILVLGHYSCFVRYALTSSCGFPKISDKFLKCLLIEVSVVRVTTDEVFCFVSYRVLQVCHFLNSWKSWIVVNGWLEKTVPLMPHQRVAWEMVKTNLW